ncbi:MAG: hypothetical protein AB9897_08745 [Anaerolineaceae bacterium]
MLNLPVAMIKEFLLVIVSFWLISPIAAAQPLVELSSPQEGQVLQGNVNITGSISSIGFISGEVSYAYAQTENANWFIINEITQPVNNGILAVWDTSTISDGDYQIKLSVKYENIGSTDVIVKKVMIRNYTQISSTQTPSQTDNKESQATPTKITSKVVEVTPYPTNPAALTVKQMRSSFIIGGVVGMLFLIIIGSYAIIRYLRFHK